MDHEKSHGRYITWTLRAKEAPERIREAWSGTSWIAEVIAVGIRDGKTFRKTHFFLTRLRTTPEALLQLGHDRLSIEGLDWVASSALLKMRSCREGGLMAKTRHCWTLI
jgi:hypothetical protein